MDQAAALPSSSTPKITAAIARHKSRVVRAASVAFLCVMSALFGGSFVMMVHAQGASSSISDLGERTARVETAALNLAAVVKDNTHDIAELRSQVATMNGIGLAIAAIAGVLQVIQLVARPAPKQ